MSPWTVGNNVIGIGGVAPVKQVWGAAWNGTQALPSWAKVGDGLVVMSVGRDAPTLGANILAQTTDFQPSGYLGVGFVLRTGRLTSLDPLVGNGNNNAGAADAFLYAVVIQDAYVDTARMTRATGGSGDAGAVAVPMDAPVGKSAPGFLLCRQLAGGIGGSYGAGVASWATDPPIGWNSTGEEGSYMCISANWSPKPVPPAQVTAWGRKNWDFHLFALRPAD